ncbi:hypothetical protein [Gallaecimonas xiamenensis]|uniref:Uncharacterized protein n=1 Tax=Gallaecimonas xiamenensis 3-C-1 TaxID=745411 RepID=K2JR47_9GAMM|nr:hypothetical protein [Gallaecimonas xiamenensis]EKE77808.1 hypothetical protein B3C1_00070 [Gallaecimonas xiamenensis 3-C-1]
MMYTDEQLLYFEQLLIGKAELSWRAWWAQNEELLKQQLPRSEYLRIKFGLVRYAHQVLSDAGYTVQWGPAASREAFFANLHESVLDGKGKPSKTHRLTMYDGALASLEAGNVQEAVGKVRKIIQRALIGREEHQIEEICSMQFDAEMMLTGGVDFDFGLIIANEIASIGDDDDILGTPIRYARELVLRHTDH